MDSGAVRISARKSLAVPALFVLGASLAFCQSRVVYFQKGGIYEYRIKLLELALARTAPAEGAAAAEPLADTVTTARGLELLAQGRVDIVSQGTNTGLESRFLPIRIDILRGILGCRVWLIAADRQAEFSRLRTLDEVRKLKAGFGAQWGDLAILKENGLPVEEVTDTSRLIPMIAGRRMDYFPRGINEAWTELEDNQARYPELAIERNLAFFYQYPVYFFVRKGNVALANRIGRGLRAALADGSFKRLFLRYHGGLLAKANLSQRRLFRLTNSTLPAGTPAVDTSWWLADKPH